jgi:hypothetical protein
MTRRRWLVRVRVWTVGVALVLSLMGLPARNPTAEARVASSEVVVDRLAAWRPSRAWYSYRPSTFRVGESTLGARLIGMVYDLSATGQVLQRCSGAVVQSPNRSLVWTAGHCIIRPARFSAPFPRILFVPAAQPAAGSSTPASPYGVWTAVAYAVSRDWMRHGSIRHFRQDYGALLMGRDAQGQTIGQALGGAQRISFSGVAGGRARALGYPGVGPFRGNDSLIGCGPRPVGQGRYVGGPGPEPIGIRCDMTSGASGGPWLRQVNRDGIGTVIAVTSAASNKPGYLYGPVQKRDAHAVWAQLARAPVPVA